MLSILLWPAVSPSLKSTLKSIRSFDVFGNSLHRRIIRIANKSKAHLYAHLDGTRVLAY